MQVGNTIDPIEIIAEDIPQSEATGSANRRRAEALSSEFSAPVGLLELDADGAPSWSVRVGDETTRWEHPEQAARALGSVNLEDRGAALWRPNLDDEHQWLILQLPPLGEAADTPATTAWIGFEVPGTGRHAPTCPWGPPTPSRALLAWGREVVSRLRSIWENLAAETDHPGRTEPQRLRLPDRLTRELHISDPPERYQRLAVELLREAMNVEAVAWVPRSRREEVVLSGAVDGMGAEAFRLLPDRPGSGEPTWRNSSFENSKGVRRALAVAAGPDGGSGWLVAVNPIDNRPFGQDEADLLRPVASLIAGQRVNARHYAELKELLFGVIRSLTAAIDAKDPYTLGHSERVGRIAVQLGEALGLSTNERGDLYLCGLLHDVGKIGIRDAVLQKPGPLTPEEYGQIKLHVRIGVQILADLKKLHHLLPGIAHHHEKYDGTGYPDGLAGEEIPMIARILAVADAYDAMSSTRPYNRQLAPDQIYTIFRNGSGTQWDPTVVNALFSCRQQVERIRQKGLGDSVMKVVDHTIGRARGASAIAENPTTRTA